MKMPVMDVHFISVGGVELPDLCRLHDMETFTVRKAALLHIVNIVNAFEIVIR
jgi:hypothetical protein